MCDIFIALIPVLTAAEHAKMSKMHHSSSHCCMVQCMPTVGIQAVSLHFITRCLCAAFALTDVTILHQTYSTSHNLQ